VNETKNKMPTGVFIFADVHGGFRRNRSPPRRAHDILRRVAEKVSEWVTHFQ